MLDRVRQQRMLLMLAILVIAVVLGLVAGAVWQLVAPRPELVVRGGGIGFVSVTDSGAGMDLSLGVILAACGLLAGLAATVFLRAHTAVVLMTTWVAGWLGSLVAWKFAELLVAGSHSISAELAAGKSEGEQFTGPLTLSAYGVLGLWSFVAVIVMAIALGLRARRLRNDYAKTWEQTFGPA